MQEDQPLSPDRQARQWQARRVEGVVFAPSARRVILDTEPARAAPASATFETLRVYDLLRLRRSMQGRLARAEAAADERAPAVLRLLEALNGLMREKTLPVPEVAVVRRSVPDGVQAAYSVVGEMIYLGDEISGCWEAGKEDAQFYLTLRDALLAYTASASFISRRGILLG